MLVFGVSQSATPHFFQTYRPIMQVNEARSVPSLAAAGRRARGHGSTLPQRVEAIKRVSSQAVPVPSGRRRFFTYMRRPSSALRTDSGLAAQWQGRCQSVRGQQDSQPTDLLRGVRLDERACIALPSCADLSQAGAIREENDTLRLNMSHFEGRGLCMDSCAANDIQSLARPHAAVTPLALERRYYRACGIIHRGLMNSTQSGFCPVCVGGAASGPDRPVQQDAG